MTPAGEVGCKPPQLSPRHPWHPLTTYAGAGGDPSQSPGEVVGVATVSENVPVDTVSAPLPIIIQVVSPVADRQMPRICISVVGQCTHRGADSSKNTGKNVFNVQQISSTKRKYPWRRVTTEETRNFQHTVAKYSLFTLMDYTSCGNKWFTKLTRLSEPGSWQTGNPAASGQAFHPRAGADHFVAAVPSDRASTPVTTQGISKSWHQSQNAKNT